MRRLRTNTLGVQQGSTLLFSDYKDNGVMWTGEGQRELRYLVTFDEPFKTLPVVHVCISMWDMDNQTNPRADIAAEAVTPDEFTIVFRTWGDTRIARIRADWVALGEVSDEDDWQLY